MPNTMRSNAASAVLPDAASAFHDSTRFYSDAPPFVLDSCQPHFLSFFSSSPSQPPAPSFPSFLRLHANRQRGSPPFVSDICQVNFFSTYLNQIIISKISLHLCHEKSVIPNESEMKEDDSEEDFCLDSFFVNRDYELTTFTFGTTVLELFCLRSASTDYDLTGQLIWPGAVLLNNYLSGNPKMLEGLSVIELGSGVGVTGMLCSSFCNQVVLTDHNNEVLEILKKNIDLQSSSGNKISVGLNVEKLEWGNYDQIEHILQKYPRGFDLILGADICFQQSSIPLLFRTVEIFLRSQEGNCKFLLAYVSRAKIMDEMVVNEAVKLGMEVNEVAGTRSTVSNLEGVIYEIFLPLPR